MGLAVFVKSIESVENVGNDEFSVAITAVIMDANNTAFTLSFQAARGADWRIQCRSAVAQWVLNDRNEVVDLVIMPGLETL